MLVLRRRAAAEEPAVTKADVARVRWRAKRRWGELLGPAERANQHTAVTRSHSTGDRKAVERARSLAAIPEPVFEAHLEQKDPDRLSEAAVLREARVRRAQVSGPERSGRG